MERLSIDIGEGIELPEEALTFSASRSGGPGGQNVNKVNTRATVRFDVLNSPLLSDEQKRRIAGRCRTRMNREGVLRVVSQRHRTLGENRRAAIERLAEILRDALREEKPRRKTSVPRGERAGRLESKRLRSELKRTRGRIAEAED
jgi:ribosome-associated protein